MKRRESLKTLLLASGALVSLPAWAQAWHADDLGYASSFTATEQDMLASVVDTIIPAGQSIGALTVGVDQFLQKLLDKCYDAETQQNVRTYLAAMDSEARRAYQQPFTACDQPQRQTLLGRLERSENKADKDFFTLMKTETIRGFTTSREVMTTYYKYKSAPGHYLGCVDIKA